MGSGEGERMNQKRTCEKISKSSTNDKDDLLIYLFHLFTQGKPKQLTLVFIGALHTCHIVTNMYVQLMDPQPGAALLL